MDLPVTGRVATRRLGAWVVAGVGLVLAVASLEYFFLEITRSDLGLAVVEITVLLGIAYGLAYGGYWLAGTGFAGRELWRVAGWCLLGLVATGSIGLWVVVNQYWQGDALQNPAIFGLATVSIGAAGGLLVGINEVRARSRAEEATRQREDLSVLNELLRHHMLNGTQVVLGHAERLAPHVDEDGTDHLVAIRRRADRLANLVERASDLTGKLSEEPANRPVDLSAILREELEATRRAGADVTVEADVPDGLAVRADGTLGVVFEHLLQDAVYRADDARPSVWVEARPRDDRVLVRIVEESSGHPDGGRDREFERGYYGDAGTELYLVDALVNRYGGEVRFDPGDPRGTVVVVELHRAA